MSGLTTGRRVFLIGLALVLAPLGIALPSVVHRLASNLASGPLQSGLTFSPEFVPTMGGISLYRTNFRGSFVWRGDLYFVDQSEWPMSLRAWNLSTGRSRFIAPFADPDGTTTMYSVHNDRLVVLNLPETPTTDVSIGDPKEQWYESSRYVGPFDYQGHPSVLAIHVQSPGNFPGSALIPPREVSATVLCFENGGWVERGEVPLPRSFADWNSTVTDAFQREGDVWIECQLGWGNGRTLVRRGLIPNAHDWNDDDERVTRSRSPFSDTTREFGDSVSAVEPANVAEADWPRTARERERWEAAAVNQPASALDPENRRDWRGWQPSENDHGFYDAPRWQSAREAEFASQQRRPMNCYAFPESPIGFAARRDRSLPPRFSCELQRSVDDSFVPKFRLNGREITINNDGRDVLFSTRVRRERKRFALIFGKVIFEYVIAVEALDDRAVWLVNRRADGRLILHRLDEAGAHRVASLAGPLPGIIARNAGLLFSLLAAVPALLFLIVGFGLVRGRVERTYSFGHRTVELAPVLRRGLARLMDVAVILLPLVLGLFLNEDFGSWWTEVYGAVDGLVSSVREWLTVGGQNPWWQCWQWVQGYSGAILQLLITAPVGWWPAWLSGALAVASLVAKAALGRGTRRLAVWSACLADDAASLRFGPVPHSRTAARGGNTGRLAVDLAAVDAGAVEPLAALGRSGLGYDHRGGRSARGGKTRRDRLPYVPNFITLPLNVFDEVFLDRFETTPDPRIMLSEKIHPQLLKRLTTVGGSETISAEW